MSKKHLDTKMFKDICKNEMRPDTTVKYGCGDYEVEIKVKPYCTMQEKQSIAETVWACYGGKDYRVAAHSPVFRLMVLYTYCENLKIELGRGIDAYYDLVMHTGLYDAVVSAIDKSDFNELDDVVWNYIRQMESAISSSMLDNMLTSILETINDGLSNVNIDELVGDIQKVAKAAEDGSIVDKIIDHYKAQESEKPALELVKPEDDINGNDDGGAEGGNTEKD